MLRFRLWQELRIAKRCPEIRSIVLERLALQWLSAILAIPMIMVLLPVTVARVVGYGISAAMEFLTNNVLLAPFDAIKRRRKSLFYEARDTLPLSEVRRRMGHDDPR